MHPLFATSPITKTDYLGGRFAGALIVNVLLITVVPFALMLFTRLMFVEATLLGPFRAAAYLQPYVFFLLSNVFFTGALLFAVAVFTRRWLPVFGAGAFIFLAAMVIEEVGDQLGYGELAALLEPFGFSVLSELWEFWTPYERNTRLMVFEGALLWNRGCVISSTSRGTRGRRSTTRHRCDRRKRGRSGDRKRGRRRVSGCRKGS
jgi:ABC-2 type transport system permease protein